jgi:hypothetical protein
MRPQATDAPIESASGAEPSMAETWLPGAGRAQRSRSKRSSGSRRARVR